jgi:chemotaxis protein methyltransferase CheR
LISVSRDPAYVRLKDQLIAATGLFFYSDRDELLADLIDSRLAHLGIPHCSSYLSFLAGSEGRAEMDLLIGQLTIGETYFFRDESQFAALRDIILPDILARNQASKQLRIWSAGCATGAEPYSLAILLARELAASIQGWDIRIYASDLNRDFLAQAATGRFRPWALRSMSEEMKRECFTNEGRIWTIHPRYRQWVSFHSMNLAERDFPLPWTGDTNLDLILCRHVMIYFAPETNRRLIARFHQSLEPGGWLVVAASEYNLENYTAFRTVSASGAKLYQRTAPDLRPPSVQPLAKTPAAPPDPLRPDMNGFHQLADNGDWQGAVEYGQKLLTQDRLNPAIHFYQALIFENLGIPDESERSLRQAIYLDRNFAMAHYHLGLALKRNRKTREAARSFRNALRVLASAAEDATVTAGSGISVASFKELAKMHLENSEEGHAAI